MVYLIALLGATAMGTGYVLQQRVAARATGSTPLSVGLLRQVLHRRQWWLGLLTMSAGQAAGSWAMGLSSLARVEPLLTASLLVAFAIAAALGRRWPTWQEVGGSVLLAAALGVFLAVSGPHAARHDRWSALTVAVGAGCVGALTGVLVSVAKRRELAAEAVLLATASGCLFGLQDVGTRGLLVAWRNGGLPAVIGSPWPYLLAVSALTGLFFTQSAYRAGRLDYSLPPSAATEPVVGICLGVGLLGDHVSTDPVVLLADALCGLALVGGVVLIARAPTLARLSHGHLHGRMAHQR